MSSYLNELRSHWTWIIKSSKSTKSKLRVGAGIIAIVVVGLMVKAKNSNNNMPLLLADVAVESAEPVKYLDLTDHKQNSVTSERFAKHWTFVFFGYTHCPDVCPATISQLAQINQRLSKQPDLKDVAQFFFVSVDPNRDTVKTLADYMNYFAPTFIGMTGTDKAILQFEKQLGAFHRIEKKGFGEKGLTDFYAVQHSAEIFLIDPEGRLTARFSPPMDLDRVTKQFGLFVERFANDNMS